MVRRLESENIEYFLIGSLAAMFYSRSRFTNDIDLVVQIKSLQIQSFEKLFPIEDYYCPPHEVLRDEVLSMGIFNLIHQASGVKIDIILLKDTPFYASELARRKKAELLPGFHAYIASPEDIIVKKLDFYRESGSEKYLLDIREMLVDTKIDNNYLNLWISHFGLQAQWAKVLE